jgi:molybdopterin converting factor small subunit
VAITVRLFGILAALARQRLVQFHLPRGSTLGDVVDALGQRFGGSFVERILRVPGEMHSYCALFVNGAQVDDLNMELTAEGEAAEIGVILFMASEGG